ncbi:hypothetical protein [Longimicrobium sp.]|uniref:hypothetical protein n=1 Tax=Longimicrobium sp. TaxID=2029185 RepID=UPI002E337A35|nr:hypothetical protein [Longimicrobium sp.]HEX6041933.1 hypothetical protein [Longimicrobium sp.]
MKRVVQRCPNCGVEYDEPISGPCEVCGTEVRYWCRVHGPEIGFMDTPQCPRCAAEAARPAPPPRAPAPPSRAPRPSRPVPVETVDVGEPDSPWAEAEPRIVRPPWGGREPHVVIREGAEDLAPYAMAGAGFAVRLVRAFFTLLRTVIGWALLGLLVGGGFAFYGGGDIVYSALFGGMVGGGLGIVLGAVRALLVLFSPPRPPGG